MKQKKMLTLTFSQLKQIYGQEIPEIVEIADKSSTVEDFKAGILRLLETCRIENKAAEEAREQIRLLLDYDGQNVHELSTGQDMSVQTIRLLYEFLTGTLENMEIPTDLFIEIFHMFKRLKGEVMPLPSPQRIKSRNDRWETGLDEEVREIRDENKERMLHLLIQKIENRKSKPSVRFHFEEGMSYEEKYRLVNEWWNDFRFHLAMAVKSPGELNRFLGNSLSSETMYLLYRARKKGMPFFATPYYLSLLNVTGYGYNDEAIRSYILYSPRLVETYGNIRAWEKEDIVEAGKPNAAGWLLPDGHNIHRRYPEVAILIPDTMGRACGGLCASCQRMYDFQSERLNFEFESLRPKESWDRKLRRLMTYFEEDTQLRDILITGGDALMSQNKTLQNILDAVYRMAARKQRANLERKDGEKYAELQRVRLGSRLLAYLPMRINDGLVDILREFKEKASAIGVKQFIIQTHFQTPLEVTPEAKEAIRKILSAGWIITNQLVYTVAASRRGHTTRLRQVLNSLGVVGLFDDPSQNPYNQIEPSVIGCKKHQELALETARQSMVLLKNQKNFLPLNLKKVKSIAVVGINAGHCEFGDYSGIPKNAPVSVLDGIRKYAEKANVEVVYAPWVSTGSDFDPISKNYFPNGLKAEYFTNSKLEGTPSVRI